MSIRDRLWRCLSIAMVVAALAYVAVSIGTTAQSGDAFWSHPDFWLRTGAASVLYAGSLALVGVGWLFLIRSGASLPAAAGLRLYGTSQLYKYLPTNMLHYVGRHAALRRLGIGHHVALIGAVGEIALLVPAAVLVALILGLADVRLWQLAAGLLVGGAVGIGILALALPRLRRIARIEAFVEALASPQLRKAALMTFGCYLIFFLGSGFAFALLAGGGTSVAMLIAIWAGAWVLGFVTPGAPAGIGVREALLIAATTAAGMENAAAIALAMRLVTTVGDLLFAAGAWALTCGQREVAQPF